MITIKGTTKKGQNMINKAKNFAGYTLHDAYKSFSREKENAYNDCLRWCNEENGHNFHIISANTFGFSVAWEVENGIRIETKDNSYLVTV